MKRLIAIIFAILMLTACASEQTQDSPSDQKKTDKAVRDEQVVAEPEQAEEPEVPEQPAQPVVPVQPENIMEESEEAVEGEPMPYTVEIVDGLVEDTVGYTLELPVFDCPGYDIMRIAFETYVQQMEQAAAGAIYTNAMLRGCIASVYGEVISATVDGDALTVIYSYRTEYSDMAEPVEQRTLLRFDIQSGKLVTGYETQAD